MIMDKSLTYEDRIRIGFEKIDRDLHFLMGCFREVLTDLGEIGIAEHLPWIGNGPPAEEHRIDPGMIQATSISFQLLNMVEENAANQMRRLNERSNGPLQESGLWGYYLRKLRDDDWTPEQIANIFPSLRVEPVLTAHPTESKRVTILEQHRELYIQLVHLENRMWTPNERKSIETEVKTILERLWRTGETLLTKPTVSDERASQLHYLDNVFPEVLPHLDRHLEEAWKANGWDPKLIQNSTHRPRLRFGTWVGGDRDGHPLVTAKVTRDSLSHFREHAISLQIRKLEELRASLSLSENLQTPPDELQAKIAAMASQIGDEARLLIERNPHEPWRQFISLLVARIPPPDFDPNDSRHSPSRYYRYSFDLVADLRVLRDSLVEIGATRIARVDVDPVLRNIEVFGFHLAALDIRQNSLFHEKAIDQILERAGMKDFHYRSWPEERRLEFLRRELESTTPLLPAGETPGAEAEAVVAALREIARYMDRHGHEGVGSYILSMTRSASDLLAIYFLAREANLLRKLDFGVVCLVPVVPLLETIEDLQNSTVILDTFFSHPIARNSLVWVHRRDALTANNATAAHAKIDPGFESLQLPVQQVMIGYSDSNKDSGILASQWSLHRAQKEIANIARERGFRIRFFHGRGGTISRGAGPTHRFLEALPPSALEFDLRVTEQGETIAQKFANHMTAGYNLDLLVAGTCYHSLHSNRQSPIDPLLEKTVEILARKTGEVYRDLLREPQFMDFYTAATPLDGLERSCIGSRPSRRTGVRTLEDLRAIPWVFSWSQSRFFLPGWYGVGSGIKALSPDELDIIRKATRSWPFLKYVMTNIETSLSSTDIDIMAAYANLVPDEKTRKHFMDRILEELALTRKSINQLFGSDQKLRRPRLEKTVHPRNSALKPLHYEQIRLLRQFREQNYSDAEEAEIIRRLLLTINAISSGLRTTG